MPSPSGSASGRPSVAGSRPWEVTNSLKGTITVTSSGGAKVTLSDQGSGTLLSYNVEAQIGGKLAQLGQRLINSAAKKTADDFFVKFAEVVAAG